MKQVIRPPKFRRTWNPLRDEMAMDTEKPWETSAAVAKASPESAAADASIILAATFTADPLVEPLDLFIGE